MAQKDDLQMLLQLAQLSQVLSAPTVEQQRLSQGESGQKLQAALSILGIQQQAQAQAEEAAIRRELMAQGGEQFAATREDRGLEREQAKALAERGLGQGDRRLSLEELSQADAARQAWAQIHGQRDLGEAGLKLQRDQLDLNRLLGVGGLNLQREDLGLRRDLGNRGLAAQDREITQRGELSREGMTLQKLLATGQMMAGRPDADMRTLGELLGAIGGKPVADVVEAGRQRGVGAQVRAQIPVVSSLKDSAALSAMESTLDPEVMAQLRAFLPPELNEDFSLLPASWKAPTLVTPGGRSRDMSSSWQPTYGVFGR